MDHEEYRLRCIELSEAFDRGDFAAAEAGWHELLGRAELPQIDRAVLVHNLALTVSAAGRDDEAESYFDQAIALEQPLMRALARAGKSDWLAGRGRTSEAVAILEQVIAEPWMTWGERDALQRRIIAFREPTAPGKDGGTATATTSQPGFEPESSRKKWFGRRG
ncbi:tetratricopeptide repeat protein [Ornithinimicrobium ciconiae]|uniref:Tetratricopeptide repeat protein n=1 Tax=Ornithinimicrobium ciconiae TaxID=2594265 RepID=A0A516G7Q4_9MICO|nr:tetratricopeptide repeat protein [Ornithinimicrobium ciconiae]QDO87549.1 tetratricopeptide repeat protein [Ornithinimicrobium ciconiae]